MTGGNRLGVTCEFCSTYRAFGTRFIVHGANPPMYRNWPKLVLPMLESTIAAAKASGARILFPGSIYNFSPDGPVVRREDTPQRATTRKGVIRIAIEQREEEAQAHGVRSLTLRAGDFFGPYITGNSWFRQLVNRAARCGRSPIRVCRISAIPGRICRMLARPWRCSRSAMHRCRLRGDSFWGPLVRARNRDCGNHTRRRCRSAPVGPVHALP